MRGEDLFYPGVQLAAWNVTEDGFHHRYFLENFLKLETTPTLTVGQLRLTAYYVTRHTSPV